MVLYITWYYTLPVLLVVTNTAWIMDQAWPLTGDRWLGNSAADLLFSCRLGISTGGENQTGSVSPHRNHHHHHRGCYIRREGSGCQSLCSSRSTGRQQHNHLSCVTCGQFVASRHHWLERICQHGRKRGVDDFLPNVRP